MSVGKSSLFTILVVSCLTLLLVSSSLFSGLSVTNTIDSLRSTPVALGDILANGDAATVQLASAQEEDEIMEICDDGVDNDGDGLIDSGDPDDCPSAPEICDDGVDNDGDGLIDSGDPDDCPSVVPPPQVPQPQQTQPPPGLIIMENCFDGVDNNGDGLIDSEDPDCLSGIEICDDGVDNDGDGLIDSGDPDDCPSVVPPNQQNSPPVALDENVQTTMNTPIDITLRASDANPTDALTAEIVSPDQFPSNGQLSEINQETGIVRYTPNPGFTGPDKFTYKVNDGTADSNIATVAILVNRPPQALDRQVQTTMNTPVDIQFWATDPDSHPLKASIDKNPSSGTLGVINQETGVVRYTPNRGFTGQDSFTYKVNDGTEDSNSATVSITVRGSGPITPPQGPPSPLEPQQSPQQEPTTPPGGTAPGGTAPGGTAPGGTAPGGPSQVQPTTTELRSPRIIHYRSFIQTDLIAAGGLIVAVGAAIFGQAELAEQGLQAFLANAERALTFGARGDDTVLPNYTIQGDGCTINRVEIELLDREGGVLAKSRDTRHEYNFFTSIGARITESHEGSNNAEVKTHWWYDTGTAVRYQVVYTVAGVNCQLG